MSVPREEFDRLNEIEVKHWWFVGMRAVTRSLCSGYVWPARSLRWLEVGCGTGYTSRWLAHQFQARLVVTDISHVALHYALKRGLSSSCQSSMTALPFAPDSFDVLSCLDVLVHLEPCEVVSALRDCRRVLKRSGLLLLRVAAYSCLRGSHDQRWGVRQRFTAQTLSKVLTEAEFEVRRITYANLFLFPLAAIKRLVLEPCHLIRKGSDLFSLPRTLESLMTLPLQAEARLLESPRLRLPFGLSVLAIAQKT